MFLDGRQILSVDSIAQRRRRLFAQLLNHQLSILLRCSFFARFLGSRQRRRILFLLFALCSRDRVSRIILFLFFFILIAIANIALFFIALASGNLPRRVRIGQRLRIKSQFIACASACATTTKTPSAYSISTTITYEHCFTQNMRRQLRQLALLQIAQKFNSRLRIQRVQHQFNLVAAIVTRHIHIRTLLFTQQFLLNLKRKLVKRRLMKRARLCCCCLRLRLRCLLLLLAVTVVSGTAWSILLHCSRFIRWWHCRCRWRCVRLWWLCLRLWLCLWLFCNIGIIRISIHIHIHVHVYIHGRCGVIVVFIVFVLIDVVVVIDIFIVDIVLILFAFEYNILIVQIYITTTLFMFLFLFLFRRFWLRLLLLLSLLLLLLLFFLYSSLLNISLRHLRLIHGEIGSNLVLKLCRNNIVANDFRQRQYHIRIKV
mmetsp:Transcript_55889/g.93087  ORF Transcript_55889/g.93087 Transcript_55889/m.93087 type:complete len:428 (-) Transcript_55889:764-2047(-)